MNDMSHHPHPEHDTGAPVPAEMQDTRGGRPRIAVWVILVSALLCLVIGGMILTDTDEVPPSELRSAPQVAPEGGPAPSAPQPEPQTRQ